MPVYRKLFEAAFFITFLVLYYAVLVERKQTGIGILESLMYIWIVAFAYDELSGIVDAGVLFYQMDFWSLWNLAIIVVGSAFVIASESKGQPLLPGFLGVFNWITRHRGHRTRQTRQLHHGPFI